jgi:hypothetical protein
MENSKQAVGDHGRRERGWAIRNTHSVMPLGRRKLGLGLQDAERLHSRLNCNQADWLGRPTRLARLRRDIMVRQISYRKGFSEVAFN